MSKIIHSESIYCPLHGVYTVGAGSFVGRTSMICTKKSQGQYFVKDNSQLISILL